LADNLRSLFLLDPDLIYLNHGSFGACPRPVFEAYQTWQRKLESQPTAFLGRQITAYMAQARNELGWFLHSAPNDLVYFTNPTTAINMVIRSLPLSLGDEVLASNHEYGAMDRTWHYYARKKGFRYINHPVPVPVGNSAELVHQFWQGVTPSTKVIFISHITSPTGLIFPVKEICRRARQAGILTIIDGAHAPGQIALDLSSVGADLYTGALHKWLCAPKGAAFLYAAESVQAWLDPLVISWGYESEFPSNSQFIDYHEWQGTRDMSAFLSVPAALQFQKNHDWDQLRFRCHQLAEYVQDRVNRLMGSRPLTGAGKETHHSESVGFAQMVSIEIPPCEPKQLQAELLKRYRIEVPVLTWEQRNLLRVSIQAYNREDDADALIQALTDLVSEGFFR
jgi:isopenicillin-N epimerase